MGLISIGGLGSGLDVSGIVEALVGAERAPKENSLNRLESGVTVTLTGLGGLKGALDEVRSAALDLSLPSSFNKRKVTTSSNEFFTATSTNAATPGKYNIEVEAIARASFDRTKVFTGGSATTFGTGGTLTFTVGSKTFDVPVLATDTLADVRNNINAASGNSLVSVSILNNVTEGPDTGSVLTFDSTTLGAGNDLVITYSGDASLADLSTALPPANHINAASAAIKINGLSTTSSTNTFSDVIEGVTINVSKVQTTPGTTESVTVALDKASTKTLISNFVEAYNAYNDVVKALGSAEKDAEGLLLGDFTLRQASTNVRNLFSSTVAGVTGSFNSLSAIGISSTVSGKLEINSTTLDNALTSNFDQFDDLFSGTNGFATKLRSVISEFTSSSGVISSRETALTEQLGRIADERLTLNLRIEQLQLRLTNQFAAMDTIVAQMNSTQSFLTQQFDSLPGFSKKK